MARRYGPPLWPAVMARRYGPPLWPAVHRPSLAGFPLPPDIAAMMPTNERSGARQLAALVIAAVSCCLLAGELYAQRRDVHQRSGLWVMVGFGSANNNLTCEGCVYKGADDGWRGGSGSGAVYGIGGAITRRWLAGIEFNPTGRGAGTWTERGSFLFMILGVVQYYPWPSGGAHVNLGVGPISASLSGEGGGAGNTGIASRLGVGYDIRSAWMRSVAITPYLSAALTRFETGVRTTFLTQAGVALRWY
jgi:hypothetical protein